VDNVGSESADEATEPDHGNRVGERRLMVLPPRPGQNRKRPELAQPVDRYPVVVLHGCNPVLPHGGNDDIVPTKDELTWDQATLDLCAADVRRVVICRKQDAHDAPLARNLWSSGGHEARPAAVTVS
jgi:hypothetical protein